MQVAQAIFVLVLLLVVSALAAGYVLKAESFRVDFLSAAARTALCQTDRISLGPKGFVRQLRERTDF